jgi:hypothetical protein
VPARLASALASLALFSHCGGQSVRDDKASVGYILFELEYWEPYCERALSCGRLASDCTAEPHADFGPEEQLAECLERLRDRELDACKDALVAFRDGIRTLSCEE